MSEQENGPAAGTFGGITVSEGAQVLTAYLSPAPHDMMSEEECLRHGGHCFEGTGEVKTSIPPQYVQKCKHCGKGRVAVPREPFEYRDWPVKER